MRLGKANYRFLICFGAVAQVRARLLRASQPEISDGSGVNDIALNRVDAGEDSMSDSELFRARVNDKLIKVNDMVNDLVNDLVSARDSQVPAGNVDAIEPVQRMSDWREPDVDASIVGNPVVTLPSDASDATATKEMVSGSAEVPIVEGASVAPADNVTNNLNAAKLAWLHTPKAGTSFANVVIAWGCPNLLGEVQQTHHHAAIANKFCMAHMEDCPTGHSLCSSHSPIDFKADPPADSIHSWRISKGNFVGMFRKPEQRHISGFYDDQLMSTFGVDIYHGHYRTALEYAKANEGCSTKLLVGKPCNDKHNVTEGMAEQARQHLDQGFAFVGLTEEWELSVCLFHRMFGGQCDVREFGNIRPGLDRTGEEYDTSELEGWQDPFDGPLYEFAKYTFWSNVAKFDVSWESCRNSICPGAAQYF